nr:hypothetical protein [Tanacetum cinerariifolium]
TWTEGGWMFSVLGSSVSFVASSSLSITGGGIGGPSYEIPLWVVMDLASFIGFGMRRFVEDRKNEKVKKIKEEHSYSLLNRSLDFVNIALWIYFRILTNILEFSGTCCNDNTSMEGEYSQWVERFMNYLEEQTDGETMINSIKNGDQPLPHVTQVSIAGTTSTEQPPLKDKSMWSDQEKRVQKIDRLARSLLIQGLPNDIYSLIDNNKTAKDLWDSLVRHMLGSEYGEQDRKAAVLYEYETFKATEGELLLDTYIRYLQVINNLKKCGYSKDNYKCEQK